MGALSSAAQGLFGQVGGAAQGFANDFTAKNGYQSNLAGQDLSSLLAGTQANTAQNQANQNSLGQQLLAESQGQGPNPAQLQLQQALNQNQQNQAGAIASQKGINPGLAQKQIMTNGANQAQQAAGQGALLGAQQQIAAQGQLGGLYNQVGGQNLANQGQYEGLLGSSDKTNAASAAQNTAASNDRLGGLLNGAGAAMGFAQGGEVPHYASGGTVNPFVQQAFQNAGITSYGSGVSPMSLTGGMTKTSSPLDLMNPEESSSASGFGDMAGGPMDAGGASSAMMMAARGGAIPDMHKMMAMLGHAPGTSPNHPVMMALRSVGGPVPGQEVVPGNSSKNDVVPSMLSAKEIVLPKSVTMADDPGEAAKSFVEQIKGKTKKGDSGGYAKVIAAKRKVS